MKQQIKWKIGMFLSICFFFIMSGAAKIMAQEASVSFGSESYEVTDNESFTVGVYLNAESKIGAFEVKISYDNQRLEYLGGGHFEENGVITLTGTSSKSSLKYMLKFQTLSGGTADLTVTSAELFMLEDEAQAFEMAYLPSVPILISGEDMIGESVPKEVPDVQPEAEPEPEPQVPQFSIPVVGETQFDGQLYYIVDVSQHVPENADFSCSLGKISYENQEIPVLVSADGTISFVCLMNEQEQVFLYAYSEEKQQLYPCNSLTVNGEKYYFMSPYVCSVWPNELTLGIIQSDSIVYAMDLSGQAGFYKITTGNKLQIWDSNEGQELFYEQMVTLVVILGVTLFIMAAAVALVVLMDKTKRQQKKAVQSAVSTENETEDLQLDVTKEQILEWIQEEQNEKPIAISVEDVTMKFRIAINNVSGVKEYVIQLLKKQISYRELLALDHISFDVYKGEVVGIIGTNGSGKSTLLKIVSGALKPTSGQVVCDRRKVQLLTLGTGFDMELTAKENVYLNGAIIGYSKEFIDEKYDEIVQFAELDGFMEEKVKNFSSGMVSRLAFSIATIGETAEILILDEVLAVGDEFFRKKSLKRVKEMIHGGSTVLMVSHGMGTILENCDRAVWIEKGKLKMIGEPKAVCGAYRKMNEG